MAVQLKFCGLTRQEDVAYAEVLRASYVGAIFAGGPRCLTSLSAAKLFQVVQSAKRVGVFGPIAPQAIVRIAMEVPLDVVQLHADPTPADVAEVKGALMQATLGGPSREVWAVVRIEGDKIPQTLPALMREADAVLLDTRHPRGLGGTGATFSWWNVAEEIDRYRASAKIVVAGGLTPENVGDAIRALDPAIIDVSSGVEKSPGIKDSHLMRRFADAARTAEIH